MLTTNYPLFHDFRRIVPPVLDDLCYFALFIILFLHDLADFLIRNRLRRGCPILNTGKIVRRRNRVRI